MITRAQHNDADGTLLQYAETINPPELRALAPACFMR